MRSEDRWVIDCLRAAAHRKTPAGPLEALDWPFVLAFAEAERFTPVLAYACRVIQEALPSAVRTRLDTALVEATARHVVFTAELARLLKAFARAGVPVIPLKGPALAETLYPHPALRPYSDIDLFIRPGSIEAVDTLLQGLGYRRLADAHSFAFDIAHDRATLYEAPSGVHVDLHWALSSEPRYAWNERDTESVWERARRVGVAGEEALALCPEDLLIYLAVHLAVHHSLVGLLWYYDLYLLLDRAGDTLDWAAVTSRAARWRARGAVYFALSELERVFGARPPAGIMARLKRRGPRAAAIVWLLRHRTPLQRRSLEHAFTLLLVDRGRDVVRTLGRMMFPTPAWLEARYAGAASSRSGYYLAHYRRLCEVMGQATAGLRRPGP
jgi:Uncharacterised nucleotidyltransferase